jgi:hypothetical protein
LPSFLINYFGQKRIGKRLFLAENGSIKKTISPAETKAIRHYDNLTSYPLFWLWLALSLAHPGFGSPWLWDGIHAPHHTF